MGKITDSDYCLPHIYAVSPLGEAGNGTTAPVIIRGINEVTHDETTEYFLKPVAAPRMSVNACMFELLAAFMAKQIELNVAEPVLINISQDFADICRGKPYYQKIQNSIGINFGTVNFGGSFYIWQPDANLSIGLEDEALKIFVFDLLIQNIDRGHQKANINTNGKAIKIFDHELAFSYTALIGYTGNSYQHFDENGADALLIKSHLFYKYLKRRQGLNVDDCIKSIQALDNTFWDKAEELIPTQWLGNNFQKIKNHTQNTINNFSDFTNDIKRILL